MAATEDVAVEMGDGFATIGAVIDDEAVAAFFQAELIRYFRGLEQESAQ